MAEDPNYKSRIKILRTGILEMQEYLKKQSISTIILVTGFDGAGKGQIIHRFNEWLDPRTVQTHSFWHHSDEERDRPYYWRYWKCMPPKGKTAIFFGSWYADLIAGKVYGEISEESFHLQKQKILFFEKMLTMDGVHLLKFWLHLTREEQLSKKEDLEKNTQFHWKTQPDDWFNEGHYQKFWEVSESVLQATDHERARWISIPAADPDYRDYLVAKKFVESVQLEIKGDSEAENLNQSPAPVPNSFRPLAHPNGSKEEPASNISKEEYETVLPELQEKLFNLAWEFYYQKKTAFLIFEGWDAAGKGGCIRRIIQSIDARLFEVIPVSAPTQQEHDQHYLWRFWRDLPRAGRMAIFDRSWYGRVLVERVEGFAKTKEWQRAYEEIIEFEHQLISPGNVMQKFWLEISPETQLKRFQKRQDIPFKRFKIGPEDWRNRGKWDEYQIATDDMIQKTSSQSAPWAVINANNKKFARIEVLKIICKVMSEALNPVSKKNSPTTAP